MTHYILEIRSVALKPLRADASITHYNTYADAIQDIKKTCELYSNMDKNHPDFFKRVQAQMKRFGKKDCTLPKIYVHCENGQLDRILFKLTQVKEVVSFDDVFKEVAQPEQLQMKLND